MHILRLFLVIMFSVATQNFHLAAMSSSSAATGAATSFYDPKEIHNDVELEAFIASQRVSLDLQVCGADGLIQPKIASSFLTAISLVYCDNLREVEVNAPTATFLDFSDCSKLTKIGIINGPCVTRVNLANCHLITQKTVLSIIATCSNLEQLDVRGTGLTEEEVDTLVASHVHIKFIDNDADEDKGPVTTPQDGTPQAVTPRPAGLDSLKIANFDQAAARGFGHRIDGQDSESDDDPVRPSTARGPQYRTASGHQVQSSVQLSPRRGALVPGCPNQPMSLFGL